MFDGLGGAREATLEKMTEGYLIKRAGTAEEVADALIFVMQNKFVTGTTIDVDGGRILS